MKSRRSSSTKPAFTIVELSLAMAFVSVLLISVALVITNVVTIYQKGLTIKAINSVGKELVDDFTRSISASLPGDPVDICHKTMNSSQQDNCKNDGAKKLTYQQTTGNVTGFSQPVPISGVFCTGEYSYIWRTGYAANDDTGTFTVSYNGNSDFHLLRVTDKNRLVCANHIESNYNAPNTNTYTGPSGATELIKSSESDLYLYDFSAAPVLRDPSTGHGFYSATFILATLRGDVDITANSDYCKAEVGSTLSSEFNYCALNKFNFATQAIGESNHD